MAPTIRKPERSGMILIVGDLIVALLMTVAGFANHSELSTAGLNRMAATFVAFAFAWFVVLPWLGCFEAKHVTRRPSVWRPPLAAALVRRSMAAES